MGWYFEVVDTAMIMSAPNRQVWLRRWLSDGKELPKVRECDTDDKRTGLEFNGGGGGKSD